MTYLSARQFKDLSYLPRPVKKEGSGIANAIIDHLPFELHLPGGYQYLGPGTKLKKKLREEVAPLNPLDAAARDHDQAYSKTTSTSERAIAEVN